MLHKFFKNIFKQNGSTDNAADEQQVAEDKSVKAERIDYIAMQQTLTEGVIANIHGLVKQFGTKPNDYTLYIYINEIMLYQSCQSDAFKTELSERLLMDCGYTFPEIKVNEGMPPANLSSRKITEQVFICLEHKIETIGKQARITALEGSLVQDEVILDSAAIEKIPGRRMNIGIGQKIKLRSGVVRINHIAVDDDPKGECFDLNKYVSRSHAYITYNKNEGFVLTVELGGTPEGEHRTMVYRNNQEIKLEVPGSTIPLMDGDQIILSRNVTLYFEIIKND